MMEMDPIAFVYPQFLKAGRFSYVVEYPTGVFHCHQALVHARCEPLPVKTIKVGEVECKETGCGHSHALTGYFEHEKSVFSSWKFQQDFILANDDKTHINYDKLLVEDLKIIARKDWLAATGQVKLAQMKKWLDDNYKKIRLCHLHCFKNSSRCEGIDYPTLEKFVTKELRVKKITT